LDFRWYHTIELPDGTVTPGFFDTRRAAATVPLPSSLRGKRCLDVGTYDGFWAFEMERRGAAEVVAVDVLDPLRWDWPGDTEQSAIDAIAGPKRESIAAFDHAAAALRSKVERRDLSIYELSPETVGEFDVVYCGSLTLHLRDPVGALAAVRTVCRELLVYEDAIDVSLSRLRRRTPSATFDGRGRPWWFRLNEAALARVAEAAGFDVVAGPLRFDLPYGAGGPEGSDPHAALLARPRRS
jgi:tRNA (mo5U34)-methyltransferase